MSDNPFEGLRVNPYVKTYVGSPIEEFKATAGALQKRHDTNLATMDQLARAYGNIKAVPGDQSYLKSYGNELKKDIEEYSKEPEHAVAGVMAMARDFALNPQLKRVQKTYADYMADIEAAREKGVSPFQEQNLKDAMSAYTGAGGAESLQVYRRPTFYDEEDMQSVADTAVKGLNTEISTGTFDEEGNLAGAYYTDASGNRIQVKRTDSDPQRIAYIAASRLLQDPATRRELIDRYRYNQGEKPQTSEALQDWVMGKYINPVVSKYAGVDLEYKVSGKGKGGSGSGAGGALDISDFIFEANQPSYFLKNAFDIDKFEKFSKSGPYVFDLDQRVEKGGSSAYETYQMFNERQIMTETIRKGINEAKGRGLTPEQVSILEQFTDDEIRGLFYQQDDEFEKAQNVIGMLQDVAEDTTPENFREVLSAKLKDTQLTGAHRGLALGPQPEEDLSSELTEYFADMLENADSAEQFFNIIENPSNYPMTAKTGSRYDWDEVGNLLMTKYNVGEEQAKDLQDDLERFTSKSMFSQNLEDYITDEGISDVAVTPRFVNAKQVFSTVSSTGKLVLDQTDLDAAEQTIKSFMYPVRPGTIQAVNSEGRLVDWAEVFGSRSQPRAFQWDKLKLTGIGSTNAPGMFEVAIPQKTGSGTREVGFRLVFPGDMTNLSKGVADRVSRVLDPTADNSKNPLLPVYMAHNFSGISRAVNASAIRNNKTQSPERLSTPGVEVIEKALQVDKIIPVRNDSGRFYFEDEEENNILNAEFGTAELATHALIKRYFNLKSTLDSE